MSSHFFSKHPMSSAPSLSQMTGGSGVSLNTINGLLAPMKSVDENLIALINNNQTLINSNLALINTNDTRLDTLEPVVSSLSNTTTTQSSQISTLQSDTSSNTESITNLNASKQNLITSNSKLPASLLDTTTSPLRFVDVNFSISNSFQNTSMSIDMVQNQVNALSTTINTQNTSLSTLSSNTSLNTNNITTLQGETTNLLSTKQDAINENNMLNSSFISTGLNENLSDKLVAMSSSIDSKQPLITSLNKVPISNVNLTGSSLQYVDISNSLSNTLSGMNNAISVLTGLQNSDETALVNINNSISSLQTGLTDVIAVMDTKQDTVSLTNKLPISHITNLQTNLDTLSNNISTLTGLQNNDLISFQFIDNRIWDVETDVSALQGQSTNNSNAIAVVQTNLNAVELAKQDVINDTTNKLPSSHVDYSTSALRFIDISSNLQPQLNGINTNLTNINSINTSQVTTNNSVATSISNLNTIVTQQGDAIVANADAINLKQDILSASNKLPIGSVSLVGSSLAHVDIGSSLQTQLNAINSSLSSNTTTLSNHSTNITNLLSKDVLHDTAITSLETADITLQDNINLKQDIIDGTHLLPSTFVNTAGNVLLSNKLSSIDANIASNTTLLNTKQDMLSLTNTLPISHITNLQTNLNNLSNSISTLQGLQDGDIVSFQNLQTQIDNANTEIGTKQNILTTNSIPISYVTNLQTNLNNINNSISTLQGLQDGDITSFQTINTTLTTHGNNITANQTATALVQTNLDSVESTLTASIGTKHPTIDVNNKLPASLLDVSTSALRFVNITSNLQESLNGINNTITLLQQEDTDQNALNNTFTTDITALQTGKQNLISIGSKLASSLVSYGASTVSASLDALNTGQTQNSTDISSLTAVVASNKTTSDTAEALLTTNLNTGLNLKQNLITSDAKLNASLVDFSTSNIRHADTSSSIQGLINGINTNISNLTTSVNTKNDIIDASNKLSSDVVSIGLQTLTGKLEDVNTAILGKHPVISSNAKLNASLVDFSSSNIRHADTTSSIQLLINEINTNISNNTTAINTKNNVINGTNLLSSDFVSVGLENLTTKMSNVDVAISAKHPTISTESKLLASLIDFSTSNIRHADTTSSIQGLINTANSNITTNTNSINTLNSSVSTLQSADVIHNGQIASLVADVATKNAIINASNKLSSDVVSVGVDTLTAKLASVDTAISGKQSTLNNTTNKLAIDKVDLTGSSLAHIDISSSLQTQLTGINNTITTITGLNDAQSTDLINLTNSIATKNPLITTEAKLASTLVSYNASNVSAKLDDLQTQVNNINAGGYPSITYDAPSLTTTIANNTLLTNLKFSGDNSIQTSAFTSAKNTELSTASSNISTLQTDVTTLQSSKHPTINAGAKLNSNLVSYNATNVSADLDQIHTDITALQSSDSAQTTNITNLTTSVNTLTTSKNNVIDVNNKIASDYVSYNATTVKATLDANVTSISTNSSNIATNTANIATNTSNIALKSNIDNPVFTTKIETPALKITGGTPSAGKILTSDANGDATWQTASSGGLTHVKLNNSNTTGGVYSPANNSQSIVTKDAAATNSTYRNSTIYGLVTGDANYVNCIYEDVSNNRVFFGFRAPFKSLGISKQELDLLGDEYVDSSIWMYSNVDNKYTPLQSTPNGQVNCFCNANNGYLYVGGSFTTSVTGGTMHRICKINLSTLAITQTGGVIYDNPVLCMAYSPFNNRLYIGGLFVQIYTGAGATASNYKICYLTPSAGNDTYYALNNVTLSANGQVSKLECNSLTGEVYAFGTFTTMGNVSVARCCRISTTGSVTSFSAFSVPSGNEILPVWVSPDLWICGNITGGNNKRINRWTPSSNTLLNHSGTDFHMYVYNFSSVHYKNGIIYLGSSFYNGIPVGLSDNTSVNKGSIATFDTTSYVINILPTTLNQVCAIWCDLTGKIWSGWTNNMVLMFHTKNYYVVKYNNRLLGVLFNDGESAIVNTIYDGINYYGQYTSMNAYKN